MNFEMIAAPHHNEVAALMAGLRQGTPGAAEQLVEIFYPELRKMAAGRMYSEASDHTWQPTVLVNELYLELRKIRQLKDGAQQNSGDDRTSFLALAAYIMKRLLIHHARPLYKRIQKLPLPEDDTVASDLEDSMAELDQVMTQLESVNPKLRRVVEMKVWEGLTEEEIAARLGCSPRSVERYWSLARHWLKDNYLA